MEELNKIKFNGHPKTTFELAVEILQNNLDFTTKDFLEFAKTIELHFIENLRQQRTKRPAK